MGAQSSLNKYVHERMAAFLLSPPLLTQPPPECLLCPFQHLGRLVPTQICVMASPSQLSSTWEPAMPSAPTGTSLSPAVLLGLSTRRGSWGLPGTPDLRGAAGHCIMSLAHCLRIACHHANCLLCHPCPSVTTECATTCSQSHAAGRQQDQDV